LGDSIYKITRAKWAAGMAQAVKHLLHKHETEFIPRSHQKTGKIKKRKENPDKPQHINDFRKKIKSPI
jgi:hypothetical protein